MGYGPQGHKESDTTEVTYNISYQNRSDQSLSRVRLCGTPWTAGHQAPLSTGFSKQEYWSGLPFPSPYFPINVFNSQYRIQSNNVKTHAWLIG